MLKKEEILQMTNSTRQGLLVLFSILMVGIGIVFLKMSYFEVLLICCLTGIIVKLTDIEEKINDN